MKKQALVLAVLLVGVFLVGCGQKEVSYNAYSQQPPPGQGAVVGGGCGVAQSGDVANTQVGALDSENSGL